MIKAIGLFISFLLTSISHAMEKNEEVSDFETRRPYSITEEREPCEQYNPLRSAHFGDMHVHTAWSFDASSQDTRNTPNDAYKFAKGGLMGIQPYDENNQPLRHIQIDRPLDFTAVTDHAEFLGEIKMCMTAGSKGYWHPVCLAHRYFPNLTFGTLAAYGMVGKKRWGFCGEDYTDCMSNAADRWGDVQAAAEEAYDRSSSCKFTSFIGYEWTGTIGAGQNLHHNVIFRNHQVPDEALSWIETPSQTHLWDYFENECQANKPGCDAISIPHNSNLSGGIMFETARLENEIVPIDPVTKEEAERRAHWNPLFEVMQHKGSSECDNRTPTWAADEYCNFEKLGYDSFGGKNTGIAADGKMDWLQIFLDDAELVETRLPEESNFLRYALKKGLKQEAEIGANAFKYGLISSTDTHIAAPGLVMEKNHPGHGGAGISSRDGIRTGLPDEIEYNPGGLAVLYSEENTRDSLFAAMRRREAYATTGTRVAVRFFGGWDYTEDLCSSPNMVEQGYSRGVPMGGQLNNVSRSGNEAPVFIVSAQSDAGTPEYPGNPLQRIQLIKGWYVNGKLKEKVMTVAGGDNNASVDINTCQTSGEGHQQLCSIWRDPEFDEANHAFYYTRVLENPSCRWSQMICAKSGVQCDDPSSIPEELKACCSKEHKPIIQERAWSSPIWFTP